MRNVVSFVHVYIHIYDLYATEMISKKKKRRRKKKGIENERIKGYNDMTEGLIP